MYAGAVDRLGAAGYLHYEISNFCLPSRASRHNLKYWRSQPYLGAGPSAHSYLARRRFGKPADMALWRRWARAGDVRADEHDYTLPSDEARAREALVLEMRLREGVELAQFRDRWGYDPARALAREISDMESAGLVQREAGRLALTRHGLLLSNEVFARLL
jgi:oxygen-independent coproporphyrinogen-3 oxidase